jgi:hypothetical protein
MLSDRQQQLRSEIEEHEAAAEEIEGEEDGDASSERAAAESAREQLAMVTGASMKLDAARRAFARESSNLQRMGHENTAQARKFLAGVQEDIQGYLVKQVTFEGLSGLAGSVSGSAMNNAAHADAASSRRNSEAARYPLPAGFVWASLDHIEATNFTGPDDFKKVSHEQMKRGFQMLEAQLLPTFEMFGAGVGRDWFRTQDLAKRVSYEDGKECVFDAFFGADPISLSRTDGNLSNIANGRHRIAVARELGWSSVPVIFTDQKRV